MENGSNSFRLMKTNGQLAPQGRGRGQLQQGNQAPRQQSSKATRHGNLFAQVSLPSLMGSSSSSAELWRQLSLCMEAQVLSRAESATRESKAACGSTSAPATQLWLWLGMSFIRHNLKPSAPSGVKVELQTTAAATS